VPIDTDKIDETVLALLRLTLHDRARAWKGHDWEALNRLHRKGMIGDPVGVALGVAERLRLRPMWSSDRKEPPLSRHPLQEGGAVIAKAQAGAGDQVLDRA